MDNRERQERLKYARIQRMIRTGAIVLALVLSLIALINSCGLRQDIQDLAAQLRAKKLAEAQAQLQVQTSQDEAEEPSPSPTAGGRSITLSFVGDITLGSDLEDGDDNSFQLHYSQDGADYFFKDVKSIFEGDDLTVASLTSTLTTSENRADKSVTFRADPSCRDILPLGGIDAVSVANDHTHDYGNEGYVDTLANLDKANVGRFGYDFTLLQNVAGISVGLTGVWENQNIEDYPDYATQAKENIRTLQDEGAQIIIVELHWGKYSSETPSDAQVTLAHQLIDAGADLIVGHYPGTIQSVELYHGKYIAYSLGTFLTGSSTPADYDTIILQQTFTLVNGAVQPDAELNIIPCSLSNMDGDNTYRPAPAEGAAAQRVMTKLYERSDAIDGGIRPE